MVVKFISSRNGVSLSIVRIENDPMQEVAMTFGQGWVAIYLYSLAPGIVVARLISSKFSTY